jgi:hypothetical protein
VAALRHYVWVVYAVEEWSGRPGGVQQIVRPVLRELEARALGRSGIDPARARREATPDGVAVTLPAEVPLETISARFADALCDGIEQHDSECPPAQIIRLRLALHVGAAHEGQPEEGPATAGRLVGATVLRRVLAAATGSALALIVSDDWYQAAAHRGARSSGGYQEVRLGPDATAGTAWVRVPGCTQPPGLLPADRPGAGHSPAGLPDEPTGTAGTNIGRVGTYNNNDFRQATFNQPLSIGNTYYGGDERGQYGGAR